MEPGLESADGPREGCTGPRCHGGRRSSLWLRHSGQTRWLTGRGRQKPRVTLRFWFQSLSLNINRNRGFS